MRKLDGLYDRLTAQERATVALEALARDDRAEFDRLATSCPRFTYSLPDAAFMDRWEGAQDLGVTAYMAIVPELVKLQAFDAARPSLELAGKVARIAYDVGIAAGLDYAATLTGEEEQPEEDAAEKDLPPEPEYPEELFDVAGRMLAELEPHLSALAARAKAAYVAYDGAARHYYGIPVLTALAAASPGLGEELAGRLERLADVEPDPAHLAEVEAALGEVLNRVALAIAG